MVLLCIMQPSIALANGVAITNTPLPQPATLGLYLVAHSHFPPHWGEEAELSWAYSS